MQEYENRTRQELDAALRTLLEQRPLERLRVRELTELCGLRRQSFYYHFKDVYDLFAWSARRERALLLERQEDCVTWQQALLDLLDRIDGNRAFYQAVLDQGGPAALGALVPLDQTLGAALRYYRDRSGAAPDPEAEKRDRRRGEALLLPLLESWIRGGLTLPPEEIAASLEETVQRIAEGVLWRTLRERGDWTGAF